MGFSILGIYVDADLPCQKKRDPTVPELRNPRSPDSEEYGHTGGTMKNWRQAGSRPVSITLMHSMLESSECVLYSTDES